LPFSSVLQKDNFYATQFHPEKSAGIGEQILKNFINI
jgi:glutamine amidotransferase